VRRLADRDQSRFAFELLANGAWSGAGVLGPEAFDALPFLDLLASEYGSPWGMTEMSPAT
jgi:saccharopine dehydrogenase-like NADP-dependent oxidoreductase